MGGLVVLQLTGDTERMISVSVEVSTGSGHFRAEIRAESIKEAVRVANASHPGCGVRLLFPIDPEVYFGEDPVQWRRRSLLLPEATEPAGSELGH